MRIVFVGTGEIGVPALRALQRSSHELVAVVTQPDKPVGREQRVEPPPIKRALGGTDIALFQPPRIKEPAAINQIRDCQPDLIVVMAYGQILPPAILEAPRTACLNLHASLLPRWRGAAPIQAAIAAGDNRTGITVMFMDAGLDTGEILLQESLPISPTETGGTLHDRLAELAPETLLKALDLIEQGQAPRIPQNAEQATYAPKLNREAGRIDWLGPAELIERKIRAFNPWPGAFTQFESAPVGVRKLKIHRAEVVRENGTPGQMLRTDKELIIAAGGGSLRLTEVQLEGRKRMSAAEFVRGNQWISQLSSVSSSPGPAKGG